MPSIIIKNIFGKDDQYVENMEDIEIAVHTVSDENTQPQAASDEAAEQEITVQMEELVEQPSVPESAPPQPQPQQTATPKKKKKGFKIGIAIAAGLAVIALSCAVSVGVVNTLWGHKFQLMHQAYSNRIDVLEEQLRNTPGNHTGSADAQLPQADLMLPAQVYESCVNTVVGIKSVQKTSSYFGPVSESYSTGSGVLLSKDGYIATNYHVIQGGYQVTVTTFDDKEHTAKVVGHDASNDIAVLKIEGENFPCATIGSSDSLFVGDKVAAIGNPLGDLTATMTVGYISAKDRLVNTDGTSINMLQTDAAINSGNSGGPLFNMYGQVVGITTAKYSGTSTSGANIEGIGFAIPIDDVVDIIDDLIHYGYVTGAYLGVMVRDMDSSVAQSYGLPLGTRVEEVTPGYCAEAAGLQVGDIIIDLGGHKVTCLSDLSKALRKFNAGDKTTITVFRSGAEVHLPITLSEKPAQTPSSQEPDATTPQYGDYDYWYKYFFGED